MKIIAVKKKDKRPTRNEISAERPLIKAKWDRLKLQNGCSQRHWEDADGKISYNLIVPSSKMKEALNEFYNGSSGEYIGVTKTLEKLKLFYWVGRQQIVAVYCSSRSSKKS